MTTMPLISIITVMRNSAMTIRDNLESVQKQDYPRIEHILVDGLSTDGTLEIVKAYPQAGNCISEPDQGIYDAMNKGIRRAHGDLVGILNSDDVYEDVTVLRRVAEAFAREGCDAVYGDLVYVEPADTCKVVRYWRAGIYRPDAFKWGWMPPHPTVFMRRSLYEKFGGFSLQFKTAADYELMLRMIHRYQIKLAYIPAVLVRMRCNGASNRTWSDRLAANRDDYRAWKLNQLKPFWFTRYLKPLRKVMQFVRR